MIPQSLVGTPNLEDLLTKSQRPIPKNLGGFIHAPSALWQV